jgi:hypothetical protein
VILITWYTTVSKERAALILKVKEYTKWSQHPNHVATQGHSVLPSWYSNPFLGLWPNV